MDVKKKNEPTINEPTINEPKPLQEWSPSHSLKALRRKLQQQQMEMSTSEPGVENTGDNASTASADLAARWENIDFCFTSETERIFFGKAKIMLKTETIFLILFHDKQ